MSTRSFKYQNLTIVPALSAMLSTSVFDSDGETLLTESKNKDTCTQRFNQPA